MGGGGGTKVKPVKPIGDHSGNVGGKIRHAAVDGNESMIRHEHGNEGGGERGGGGVKEGPVASDGWNARRLLSSDADDSEVELVSTSSKGSRSRNAFCATTLSALDALKLPVPCPSLSKWLIMRGQPEWRCSAARQHECALAMGLAHHAAGITPRRIRYLQRDHWPLLLRLRDAEHRDKSCAAAFAAYTCAERKSIRVSGEHRCIDEVSATTSSKEERQPKAPTGPKSKAQE